MSWGCKLSLIFSESSLAKDKCSIFWAMLTISSKMVFSWCFILICFCLSVALWGLWWPGGGHHFIWACLFWMVSFTVILRPFQLLGALAMSSPNFYGDRPRQLISGAKADVVPTSPLANLKYTTLISWGLTLGGMVEVAGDRWTWIWDDWRKLYHSLLWAKSRKARKPFSIGLTFWKVGKGHLSNNAIMTLIQLLVHLS